MNFKPIAAIAVVAIATSTAPVQAGTVIGNTTTYIDQQTRTYQHVPARDTGFIRVGNVTERIIAPAHTRSAWVGSDTRTRIRTNSVHSVF